MNKRSQPSTIETQAEREQRIRKRLRDDYQYYARKCLKIRPKPRDGSDGAESTELQAFSFNRAQRYLHSRAEAQKERTGQVNLIGLKGRQQGFSTYVEGRGMWITTNWRGRKAFILTHLDKATANLFRMAKRFYEHLPPLVKPAARNDNANELAFGALDSGYAVATAGGKGAGRSDTTNFFHWSEVAFCANAEEHARGAMQTVARAKGSERWLESTSDGPGNYFHRTFMDALAGKNAFEAVFVPWYWQEEYRRDAPDDFALAPDESELLAVYGGPQADGGLGISVENLVWRREQISELGSAEAFTREYPNSVEEAFAASAAEKLINPLLVQAAKLRQVTATDVWPIWGVDPAWKEDGSALVKRQGNVVLASRQIIKGAETTVAAMWWHGLDTMALSGRIVEQFERAGLETRPSHIVVDVIGIGAGVAHRLKEIFEERGWDRHSGGHPGCAIVALNVGESASQSDRYLRLRDELWFRLGEWFDARDCAIPDDEAFIQEVCAIDKDRTSAGKQVAGAKDKIKKLIGRSPDRGDALMHTFAVTPQPRGARVGRLTLERGGGFEQGRAGGWASRM